MEGVRFRVLLRCAFCGDEWHMSRWDFDRPIRPVFCRECEWRGMVPVALLDKEED